MTDVQQVESTKTKKQKRAGKQPDQAKAEWDKLVAKGKKLVAALDSNERNLGELADSVKTKYREKSLARFAEAIGVKVGTLNRCRSVYRAYKGLDSGSGASFAAEKALAGHPDRVEILKSKPTSRQATAIMRTWRQVQENERNQEQEQDWQDRIRHLEPQLRWKVIEARGWLAELVNFALEAHKKYGHLSQQHIDLEVLHYAVDEPDKVVTTLRLVGLPFNAVADMIEDAHTTPPLLPPPDSTPDQTT